jgi:hypothetical protein
VTVTQNLRANLFAMDHAFVPSMVVISVNQGGWKGVRVRVDCEPLAVVNKAPSPGSSTTLGGTLVEYKARSSDSLNPALRAVEIIVE